MISWDTSNNKNLLTTDNSSSFLESAAVQAVNGIASAQAFKGMYNAANTLVADVKYTLENPISALGLDKGEEVYNQASQAVLEHLQNLLDEKQTVTLKTLIAEPAAGAITLHKNNVGTKGFIDYIGGNLKTLGNNLMEDLGNLPEMQPVYTQIENWTKLIETVKGGVDSLETLKELTKALEPVLPIVRSVSNMALSWISAGATVAEDVQNLLENAQKLLYSTLVTLMLVVKDLILNMTITVPKLVVTGTSMLSYKKVYNYVETLQEESDKGNLSPEKLSWAMSMLVDTNSDFLAGLNGDLFNKSVVDTVLDSYKGVPSINLDGLTLDNLANKGKELLDALTVSFVNNVLSAAGIDPVQSGYDFVWNWDSSESKSDSSPNNIDNLDASIENLAKIFSSEYEEKLNEGTIYHTALQLIYNSDNSNTVGNIVRKVKPYFIG